MRLAGADVLPFEFTNLADTLNQYVSELEKLAAGTGAPRAVDFAPLKTAVNALGESAARYERALEKASARGLDQVRQPRAVNEMLYKSERKLTDEQGLPRRPWFKHQIYAPGFYTGYGVKTIPGVREAIEQKLWDEVEPQMKRVSAVILALASQIETAARLQD
jgi:N-acetylated-alpha-linked acidic dipeptidase